MRADRPLPTEPSGQLSRASGHSGPQACSCHHCALSVASCACLEGPDEQTLPASDFLSCRSPLSCCSGLAGPPACQDPAPGPFTHHRVCLARSGLRVPCEPAPREEEGDGEAVDEERGPGELGRGHYWLCSTPLAADRLASSPAALAVPQAGFQRSPKCRKPPCP